MNDGTTPIPTELDEFTHSTDRTSDERKGQPEVVDSSLVNDLIGRTAGAAKSA